MYQMNQLQCWFNLSDEGVKDAIYAGYAIRKFMGINFLNDKVSDATTLLHFRHLMEECGLGAAMFAAIKKVLYANGLLMHSGTIVETTIISALTSTNNEAHARDPGMHQTKKGNEWRFGMKAHMGVDARSGFVTEETATSTNVHDIAEAVKLIRPDDEVVYGNPGILASRRGKKSRRTNISHRLTTGSIGGREKPIGIITTMVKRGRKRSNV